MKKYIDIDDVYPIGSIYMNISDTDPASLFGGAWERIQDVFLLASGSKVAGATGGSTTHAHEYGIQYGGYYRSVALEKNTNAGCFVYDENNNITIAAEQQLENMTAPINASVGNTMKNDTSMTHYQSVGTSSYEEHIPSHLVVNIWRRVA